MFAHDVTAQCEVPIDGGQQVIFTIGMQYNILKIPMFCVILTVKNDQTTNGVFIVHQNLMFTNGENESID